MRTRPPAARGPIRRLGLAAVAVLLGAAAPADSPVDVPEPAGLYAGPQHGYTPATLAGARVVDADAVAGLVAGGRAVLLDVALADRKPANLPAGTPWRPVHRSIPGAVWLPDAGAAPLDANLEATFLARVAALTAGDTTRPVVVFCHPECWGSWNAGKRLVRAGYTEVHWFPLGIEGWQEAHDTAGLRPDAVWSEAVRERAAAAGE